MATIAELLQLAGAEFQAGNLAHSESLCRQVLLAEPGHALAHAILGHVLVRQERLDAAIVQYRQAVQANPPLFEAHYMLALALRDTNQLPEAAVQFGQATRLRPHFALVFNDYAAVLQSLGRYEEAIACGREAILFEPTLGQAHNNLATAHMSQGRVDLALDGYRTALRLQPNSALKRSNYLFCRNYDPQADLDELFAEHYHWGRLHSVSHPAPRNDPVPERRLRVGYVSPDFRYHALARYFEPVMAHHDPQQVEIFCYAEVPFPDAVTARLEALAHGWRSTCGLSETQVVQQIRDDRIDILVDLAGHSANNRLCVFAHKPAPVQATWFGYLNTTGLPAIDYRLTDSVLDPAGQPRRDTEELLRLPSGMCCFGPPADAPDAGPLPAVGRGHLTFGSLHNLFKLNAGVFDLWSQILRSMPTARLLVFRDTLTDTAQSHIIRQFADRGISSDRLDLRRWSGAPGYLSIYQEIDVSLDAFPVTGGVTTCESLWMGVPVLSLKGARPAGRNSAALLSRVGLGEWAVDTAADYLSMAVGLAGELDRLSALRASLRGRVQATLCDAAGFTRELEDAYRAMWRRWCAQS